MSPFVHHLFNFNCDFFLSSKSSTWIENCPSLMPHASCPCKKDFLFSVSLISSASAIELNATQFNDFRFNFSAFYSRLKLALNGELNMHERKRMRQMKLLLQVVNVGSVWHTVMTTIHNNNRRWMWCRMLVRSNSFDNNNNCHRYGSAITSKTDASLCVCGAWVCII